MRLDKYLVEKLNCSRSKAISLIKDGLVFVNNNIADKQGLEVKDTDNISISNNDKKEADLIDVNLAPCNKPLDIVYDDEFLMVINKPKQCLVHPTTYGENDTIANRLVYFLGKFSNDKIRPGIVHRLDKNTSGLLVVAKNLKILKALQEQLANKTLYRKYVAICHGHFSSPKLLIKVPLMRAKDGTTRMIPSDSWKAKPAITHVNLIKNLTNNLCYVECILETGRTHQIRVHLAYIKHPIFNDALYGDIDADPEYGQYLHATEIHFIHPVSKKEMSFNVKPDKTFMTLVNKK